MVVYILVLYTDLQCKFNFMKRGVCDFLIENSILANNTIIVFSVFYAPERSKH